MTDASSTVLSDRAGPEDRVGVWAVPGGWMFVVADGAGGQGGGAAAAERVHAGLGDAPDWVPHLARLDAELLGDPEAGESTAVIGRLVGGRVEGASVGDSEAWIIGPKTVTVLTRDQGRSRLGSGRANPVAFEGRFGSQDTLVVASDGLFRGASREAILESVRAGADAVGLAEVARGASGRLYDDVGVVVVR